MNTFHHIQTPIFSFKNRVMLDCLGNTNPENRIKKNTLDPKKSNKSIDPIGLLWWGQNWFCVILNSDITIIANVINKKQINKYKISSTEKCAIIINYRSRSSILQIIFGNITLDLEFL